MKRIVCIGGWGHFFEVFQTLEKYPDARLCGIAPAFEGEDLDWICGLPPARDVPVFGSAGELLREVPAGFCIVSTRPGHIAKAAIQAANAGLDIIAEKPLGITLEETAAVEAAVEANGVRLMAIFSMRSYPVFQTARRLYREGAIGKAVLANARKSYKYGDETARPEWFGQRCEYGGTFPWIGIHAFDMIRFCTGLGVRRIAALQANQTHPSRPDCEDTCCAIAELDSGVQATVSVDYFRPSEAGTHGDDWIRIVGTDGIIEARENEQTCTLLKNGATPEAIPLDRPESLFIPFLEGREGLANATDAFELTKATLAARQAADEKRWVEI
jgi:predicted dehydrogenase